MNGQETNTGPELVKVTFEPDGIEISVPVGTKITRAALAAGCAIETTCGGMGTCGKCRVEAHGSLSEPDQSELRLVSTEEREKGIRLACRATIEGDTTVVIPTASRSLVQKILSDGVMYDVHVSPSTMKVFVDIPTPSLADERADFERLSAELDMYEIKAHIGIEMARELPARLRDGDFRVTAVIADDELIAVEPGDTVRKNYGVSFDLGTTTVAGYLLDLNTGYEVAVASAMNPQIAYGDDLVSRINFAVTEPGGLEMLRRAAVDVLNKIIHQLAEMQGIDPTSIYEAIVVGNTCMSHLFLGLGVSTLGVAPYVPIVCQAMTVRADSAGLDISPGARVRVLPNIAGFVGSDLVAVVLATLREDEDRTRLVVDVGTNGEMALLHDGSLYACSAAAGPAFEGARISCGMRGGSGAIDSVRITDRVEITTIDSKRPLGLCGSGLVDAVAEMLQVGVIEETGRMHSYEEGAHLPPAVRERLIEVDGGAEFVLATDQESGTRDPITLTQKDIRQLQLAKGSIRAAIETLLKAAGATAGEIREISLAGAFGNYIRIESALRIGLLPQIAVDQIVPVGNAAGAGARLALLSERERARANRMVKRTEHIELASHPDYQNEFTERMLFPSPMGKARTTE